MSDDPTARAVSPEEAARQQAHWKAKSVEPLGSSVMASMGKGAVFFKVPWNDDLRRVEAVQEDDDTEYATDLMAFAGPTGSFIVMKVHWPKVDVRINLWLDVNKWRHELDLLAAWGGLLGIYPDEKFAVDNALAFETHTDVIAALLAMPQSP